MRQALATLRRAPGAIAGVFVALTLSATMVTVVVELIGSAQTSSSPVQRLAAAPIVVMGDPHVKITSGHGDNRETESLPMSDHRRLPPHLAHTLREVPGAGRVVADVSAPVTLSATGQQAVGVVGHGWGSAVLTPFRIASGHAPRAESDVVLGGELARSLHVSLGARLRLLGQDLPTVRVVGIASAPGNAGATAAFFADRTAQSLHGSASGADLLGVFPDTQTTVTSLQSRLKAAVGPGISVLTGTARGTAEHVDHVGDKENITAFAGGGGGSLIYVSLFVVAGAVGLSVAGRRRQFALLRAVGATPGQIRRSIAGELAVIGAVGGLLGCAIGNAVAGVIVRGLTQHGLLPEGAEKWSAWWVLLVVCGTGILVAEIAGFVAGWRAGRADPVLALRESEVGRSRPNAVRMFLGLCALGGAVTLSIVTFHLSGQPEDKLNLALVTLLLFIVSIGLLGPVLVTAVEALVRVPIRLLGGASGRLALADMRRGTRRIASAVVAVALSIGFLGTVYLVNATASHAGETQSRQRVVADAVLTAPGSALSPRVVDAAAGLQGVTNAVGVTPTTVFLRSDGGTSASAVALTGGRVSSALDLHVTAGSLDRLRPGQIAVSKLAVGNARVGSSMQTYLADGTPYRARVVAIFDRGMGFADVVVPSSAAGGGHLGSATVSQVLLSGRDAAREGDRLRATFPGVHVSDRATANAEAERLDSQSNYLNTMLITLIGVLAAVTLINTLVTATAERRDVLRLLRRVGANTRQLIGAAVWQTLMVAGTGIVFGAGAGATVLIAVSQALTGSARPYLPGGVIAGTLGCVVVLTAAAIVGPTLLLVRQRREPAP